MLGNTTFCSIANRNYGMSLGRLLEPYIDHNSGDRTHITTGILLPESSLKLPFLLVFASREGFS